MTPNQRNALTAIRDGQVSMANAGHAAFRIRGASPQVVGRLISLGLARWPKGPVNAQTCEITDAGRKALEEDAR